jgi:FtsH-binding integral membrane protein
MRDIAKLASTGTSTATTATSFLSRVYAWMGLGLALTAVVSFLVVTTPQIMDTIYANIGVFYFLLFAELAMVFGFTFLLNRVSPLVAALMFAAYAAVNGLTLSVIFLIYTSASIVSTFFITAGMFGAMSVYGAVTKRDLTGVGSFAFMGLIGIIIASIANFFLKSDAMGWVISFCGVIVFTLLTAYDTQKAKAMGTYFTSDSAESRKASIQMALMLYLDFINLFLNLLRLFGRRR